MHSLKDLLSPTEFEIVRLVSEGKENKVIAMIRGVTDYTVRHHMHNIYEKLGMESRVALGVRFALEEERGVYVNAPL